VTRFADELRVLPSPDDVAAALADLFIESGGSAIAARGRFVVSLAGGTTPKAAYLLLAQAPRSAALDWSKVEIFFGDERCVPPDDLQSNFKTADDAFIRTVGIPPRNIHRIRGEDDPANAAQHYRQELRSLLGESPRFDLVMLGMGPDGHTASLFPGTDPYADDEMLVRSVYSPSQQQWRITLTPKVLRAARTVVFAVEGSGKAQTLARVREGPYEPHVLPAQSVTPVDGALVWLVDAAAASALTETQDDI
jgi:6-phosphogluconolactonase